MRLCDNNHDEICFEVRDCPLCFLLGESGEIIEELEGDVRKLKDDLVERVEEIEELLSR